MSVKKFRKLLRKPSKDFGVFQYVMNNDVELSNKGELKELKSRRGNEKFDELLEKYKNVFRKELPPGLPPKRSVDHEIVVEEGARPHHRPLFQFTMWQFLRWSKIFIGREHNILLIIKKPKIFLNGSEQSIGILKLNL